MFINFLDIIIIKSKIIIFYLVGAVLAYVHKAFWEAFHKVKANNIAFLQQHGYVHAYSAAFTMKHILWSSLLFILVFT